MQWLTMVPFVLLTACGPTFTRPGTYPTPAPISVATTADSLWPAIIDVVTERQLTIKTVDRASGFLQSERMWSSGSAYWDCGKRVMTSLGGGDTLSVELLADLYAPLVTITISAVPRGEREAVVRVSVNLGEGMGPAPRSGCVSRGILERELLDSIATRWTELRR